MLIESLFKIGPNWSLPKFPPIIGKNKSTVAYSHNAILCSIEKELLATKGNNMYESSKHKIDFET